MSGVKNHGSYDADELQKIYELCHDKELQEEQDEVRIQNAADYNFKKNSSRRPRFSVISAICNAAKYIWWSFLVISTSF